MNVPLLLLIALRAYPRPVREAEGEVLVGLALDMVDGGASVRREAAALAVDGLRARCARHRFGAAPWGEAFRLVGVALAAVVLAVLAAAVGERMEGVEWIGWRNALVLLAAFAVLAGLTFGRRGPATFGALALVGYTWLDATYQFQFKATALVRDGQSFPYSVDFAVLPVLSIALAILVACALAAEPRKGGARRFAWGLAVAAALSFAAVMLRPDEPGSSFASAALLVLAPAAVAAVVATVLARTGAARLAAALALAGAAPALVLALETALPHGESEWAKVAYLAGLGTLTIAGIRSLVRSTI